MGWFQKMPLFIWSLYATAIIQSATPVLAITLVLLILEKVWGVGYLIQQLEVTQFYFQHFFWFYSHPAVYIMILPTNGCYE